MHLCCTSAYGDFSAVQEEKELQTSPALEIPPQVPQVPQVPMPPMPAPVQVQHREPSPVSQRQAFLENNNVSAAHPPM